MDLKRRLRTFMKASVVDMVAASCLAPNGLRLRLYKLYGMRIGEGVRIGPKCVFVSRNVVIGEKVFINHSCCFHNPSSSISIGDHTWVAMGVLFTTSTHEIGDSQRRAGELVRKPIEVGKGCWIGAGAVILPGIVIGDGCVIGAGAVINRDYDPNGLYVGVPARRIRELEP